VTNRKRVIAIASRMDMQFTISAVLISLPNLVATVQG
jgi:hypothetical protein